jgi:hypothetical protein
MITNNETILVAVLAQLKVKGIDYNVLAKDIGAGTAKAAQKRWERCWSKLKESKDNNPAKPTGVTKSPGKANKSSPTKKEKQVKKEESDEDTEISDDLPVTPPPKRLPARKARAEKFEELATEDEDEQGMAGADDDDEFQIEIEA